MNSVNASGSGKLSQSTLLVGIHFLNGFLLPRSIKGKRMAVYLHRLLADPELEVKLKWLKSDKWKKQYQAPGQGLVPVYFYPDECDWAKLGMISYATGFSRCFIFIYLMMLDFGLLKLPNDRTIGYKPSKKLNSQTMCLIILDASARKLKRSLRTQTNT